MQFQFSRLVSSRRIFYGSYQIHTRHAVIIDDDDGDDDEFGFSFFFFVCFKMHFSIIFY